MNANDHAKLWSNDTATQLAVTLTHGTSIQQGKRAVEKALPSGSALTVQTLGERRSEVSAVLGSTLSRLNDTTIIVLIVTITSVIALMVAAIWQMQARLDSLKLIGMSFPQFARLIFYESGSVLISGCLIGIATGIAAQYLIDGWLHQTTGASVHFTPAWQLGLRIVAIAAGISLLASMIAVIQTAGPRPRSAFSTD